MRLVIDWWCGVKISVIIPAYNDLIGVMTAINSLMAMQQTESVEYLVQDDTSPDVLFPAVMPPYIKTERNKHNFGFAGNCNAGAARATGDILFFVNQDVFGVYGVSDGWDVTLIDRYKNNWRGVVGVRLLFPDGRIQHAGGFFDAAGQPYHFALGWKNREYHQIDTAREVSWVTGAALAIHSETFRSVGGFDTTYERGYFEDVDLCLKVGKVWYEPAITLVHKAGGTGGNPNFMRNAMLFKRRWVDTGKVKPDVHVVKERFWV